MNVRDLVNQRFLSFTAAIRSSSGFTGAIPLLFDRLLVHARAVKIADLLVDGISVCAATCRSLLQNLALDVQIAFVEFRKTLPLRLVREESPNS